VRELFAGEVARVNHDLAHYEQIVKWDLLPRELSLEEGELTPTQKIKRRVIHERYSEVIDRLYESADEKG
jgi:long-chain acyl-CoA synthetase